MLRQLTALFMLLAFAASSFSKAVIIVDFYTNQDYIAKNLCENRGRPMLHCHGRCQLRKRLAHDANQDKDNPERKAENKQEVLFLSSSAQLTTSPFRICVTQPYRSVSEGSPVDRSLDIFHPPA
ncbi:MAG TPA: hypothetical protein VGS79_04635 [Puia sp.]|nr:hypothetical protein [Puia sp.]